jgi:hydrogenase maturation protease
MATSSADKPRTRILCLGNDLLADDGVGLLVGRELSRAHPFGLDVVESAESGIRLLDHLLDVERVIVVDALETSKLPPGTILEFKEGDFGRSGATSAHYLSLFDALAAGRDLGLPVAKEVRIYAVAVADGRTLGGQMHPGVRKAAVDLVRRVMLPL